MIQVIYDEKSFHLKRKLKFLSFAFIVCNIDVIFSIFRYNNKYNFVHLFFSNYQISIYLSLYHQ